MAALDDAGEPLSGTALAERLMAAHPHLRPAALTGTRLDGLLGSYPSAFTREADGRWRTAEDAARSAAVAALADRLDIPAVISAPTTAIGPDALPLFVALDLEATSRDASRASIIEVAAVLVDPRQDPATWTTYRATVVQDGPLPEAIIRLTGITDADLVDARPAAAVLAELAAFVGDRMVVAHNGAGYDFPVLDRAAAAAGVVFGTGPRVDALHLAHLALPEAPTRSLAPLAALYGFDPGSSHRALDDARTLGRVVLALGQSLVDWPAGRWNPVARLLRQADWAGLALVPRRVPPAPVDLKRVADGIRMRCGTAECRSHRERTLGFLTFPVAAPEPTPRTKRPPRPPPGPAEVAALFGPNGPIAAGRRARGEPFEDRPAQREMAGDVASALAAGEVALVEAGTGTGKTKAYLHAAARYALATGRQVIVSTHTKSLQEQLRGEMAEAREVPTADGPWRAELLQGMDNYVCRRKLQHLNAEAERTAAPDPDPTERARLFSLALVLSWAAAAPHGAFGDLRAYAWAKISQAAGWDFQATQLAAAADREDCDRDRCPFVEQCLYFRAVKRAREADVVAVNHAFLLTDKSSLPEKRQVVVDEAHTLEDAATDAFAVEVTGSEIGWRLTALHHVAGKNTSGLVVRIAAAFGLSVREPALAVMVAAAADARMALEQFSAALVEFLEVYDRKPKEQARYGHQYQLLAASTDVRHWFVVRDRAQGLDRALLAAAAALRGLRATLEGRPLVDRHYHLAGLLYEVVGAAARLASADPDAPGLRELLREVLTFPDPDGWVYTAEAAPQESELGTSDGPVPARPRTPPELVRAWTLRARRVRVDQELRSALFDPADAVVLTSATLTVAGSFQFLRRRLGLDVYVGGRLHEYPPVRSDFDYRQQSLLALPAHLPAPRQAAQIEYCEKVALDLAALQRITEGRTLGLFTARVRMEAVGRQLIPMMEERGIAVHLPSPSVTGEGRQEAVELHRAEPEGRSVLLGLRSFWEGLDAPGLKLVAMSKIPFANLGDPLISSRVDAEARATPPRDGFSDYYVPLSALTFRQGFGRLVRSRLDRGVVALYDRRLRTAFYRDTFLGSLPRDHDDASQPGPAVSYASGRDFYRVVAEFLGRTNLLDDLPEEGRTAVERVLEELGFRDGDDAARAAKLLAALRRVFYPDDPEADYRPHQREIIAAVLGERDVVGVLPTASGKSLCFQLPAVLRRGITVVISPLVSLMKDQVDTLREDRGLTMAYCLNGTQRGSEKKEILEAVRAGRVKLLYVSPERVHDPRLLSALDAAPEGVCQVVVDEAHCVSLWGHAFRPEFLDVRAFVERFRRGETRPPVLALTATATPRVLDDIIERLGLVDPVVRSTSFDRPNLRFAVYRAASKTRKDAMLVKMVGAVMARDPDASVIVYCARKRDTERLASLLSALCQVPARPYHGGMERELRAHTQDAFLKEVGELRVVVATKAFGMGIDKSDIRYVFHYDMPGSLEDYYQEAGRGGRDLDRPAWCVLLHHRADDRIHRFFIDEGVPTTSHLRTLLRAVAVEADAQGVAPGGTVLLSVQRLADALDETETAVRTRLHWLTEAGVLERIERDATVRGRLKLFVTRDQAMAMLDPSWHPTATTVFDYLGLVGADEAPIDALGLQAAVGVGPDVLQELVGVLEQATIDGAPVAGYQSWETALAVRLVAGGDLASVEARVAALRAQAEERLAAMVAYAEGTDCRRRAILRHFGDPAAEEGGRCLRCDRCAADLGVAWGDVAMVEVPDLRHDPALPARCSTPRSGATAAPRGTSATCCGGYAPTTPAARCGSYRPGWSAATTMAACSTCRTSSCGAWSPT